MAEAAIGFALGRLALFLEEEAGSIHGFREQVEAVERRLQAIRCFLKDADDRSARDRGIENWVNEMRQVAYDIEDVVDTFLAKVVRYYNGKDFKEKAKRYAHLPKELIDRWKIGSKVGEIMKKIDEITRSREQLRIDRIDEGGDPQIQTLLAARRRDSCEDTENDVVGLEEKINELLKLLVEGEGRRCVISVVGQAGLGKTCTTTAVAWKDFVDGFNWDITQGKAEISRILTMGFDYLDYDLKPCLLYCCAFPGDSIRVKRLLRLWIAEGFVKKQEDRRPDAVAMLYLNELVARNFIQPCKRNSFGEIKSCRVHDVLRVTLKVTAKNQNFFQIDQITPNNRDLPKCRRLATHCRLDEKTCFLENVRSFISFAESEPRIWSEQIKNFELLRVLDLEGARSVEKLPEEIGGLVLLTYLGLRHTSIDTLPRSINKLYKLRTLDLRTSSKVHLSQSKFPFKGLKAKHVTNLSDLRHLYFGNRGRETFNAMEMPDDFGLRVKELQTLSYAKAGRWVAKGLSNMKNLRKLGMQIPEGYGSRSAFEAIAKLSQLHSLYLQGKFGRSANR
ncbi:hypothetical protein EJ110_NYTH00664 [Nymphaea thermarum]|nr:hypothetical protein EJ110_NYTH00664 [Nymphaea thermarum]